MGLDVYVGSLTRYYAHDWETIIQQAGRTQGFKVEIIRTEPEPPDTITDPQELQTGIRSWRDSLSGQLRDATIIESDLDWDERADASYFTDKPDWDCFGALVLLAAYEEEPKPPFGSRWPKKIAKDWERDGRLAARLNSESPPRYAHLYGCEVWLPVQLGVPFGGVMPSGQEVRIGSSVELLAQMRDLNTRTYGGAKDDLIRWRREMPAGPDERFEPKARTGLAIMLQLSEASVEKRLPMLLDY